MAKEIALKFGRDNGGAVVIPWLEDNWGDVLVGAVILFLVLAYGAVWMVVVCWALAQLGYTFTGADYVIPVCIILVIHIIIGVLKGD